MTQEKLEQIKTIIEDNQKSYDFNNPLDYINDDDIMACECVDDVRELLEKADEDYAITDEEIIYYSSAMEYLRNNDPSLRNACELAADMGCELKNMNSELLASILASDNNRDDYREFIDDVCNACEDLFDNDDEDVNN